MRIQIVEDEPVVRGGLEPTIRDLVGQCEVDHAGTLAAALDQLRTVTYNLILLDPGLPDARDQPHRALDTIRAEHSATPVAVISARDDPKTISQSIQRGAMAFIPKTSEIVEIKKALRIVLDGGIYLPPSFNREELAKWDSSRVTATAPDGRSFVVKGLTDREHEVMHLVSLGHNNKTIANQLGIAEQTVKTHVSKVLRALNVSSRAQVVFVLSKASGESARR